MLKYKSFFYCFKTMFVFAFLCGCPMTEDEIEELQHWCGNATGHGPEEEIRLRKGKSESRYSKAL